MKTIVYIIGDGVQYRFLRDMVELQMQRTATDELRQEMHLVRSITDTMQSAKNQYRSGRVPQAMELYFLSDLQTLRWLKRTENNLPKPDMIHVLLESPFRKKDWLENLRQIKQRADAPVDVVLCDTGRQGLHTDTSDWEDDFRAGQKEIAPLGIEIHRYELRTVPEWLCRSITVDVRFFRQRLQNLLNQMKKRVAEDYSIDYIMYAIEHRIEATPQELKQKCYQRFDPSAVGQKLSETIWHRARKSFLSRNSGIWKHIWMYYRTKMLQDMLLWKEGFEEQELHCAMIKEFDRHMPEGRIIMARNSAAYQELIEQPKTKSGDILACEQAISDFFSGIEHNAVYSVMERQLRNKISKMEKILNE